MERVRGRILASRPTLDRAMACVMVSQAMSTLSQLTGSSSHLYRAAMFTEWYLSSKERECRVPDRLLSLFEGGCGLVGGHV